jgi:Tol biopolymer transport system component
MRDSDRYPRKRGFNLTTRKAVAPFLATILLMSIVSVLHYPAPASADTCVDPSSSLVSWWPGEDNGNDIAGPNNGNLLSGTAFEAGEVGQGFSLESQPPGNDPGLSAVSGPITNFPIGDSPRTITAWVKATDVPDQTHGAVILHYGTQDGTSPPKNFHLGIDPDGKAVVGNGWNLGTVTGTTDVTDGEFHLIVGVYEGSSTDIARIYVDGLEQEALPITTPATGTANPFRIGSAMLNGNFEHAHFEGVIDEVAIFNEALLPSEILAIYDAGTAGMCTTVATGPVLDISNGHYYEAVRVYGGVNWGAADTDAEARIFGGAQGHLATINSQDEQDFVLNSLPQVKAPMTSPFGAGYWLGGLQPAGSGEPAGGWRWTTAEGFSFNAWISGEPNNFGGAEDRIAYWWYPGATGSGAHWSDIPNNFLTPGYVVEYEPTNLVLDPASGNYYEAVPVLDGINWADAITAAEGRTHEGIQGRLATITSQQEQDFIVDNLPQVKAPVILHGAGYWLGGLQPVGSSEPAGNWQWITAEPFSFQFWQPSEPNNNGGNEDRLIFWGNPGVNSGDGKKWNDAPGNFLAPGYLVEYVPAIVAEPGIIAFYRGPAFSEEIFVMNSDGSDQTNISNNEDSDADPSFSPDGSKIAFTSFRDGNYEIYVMNADGSDQENISNNGASDYYPNWSPDGTKIVFTRFAEDVHDEQVYIMNADGSGQTRLTTDNLNPESRPSFSPDGSKIAFTSFRDGNYEIYVMNPDGTNAINISNNPGFDSDSAWSPDGSQIAFASFRDGNFEVYVMDSSGSDQTNLSNNDGWDALPAWSPDGSQIAFHSNRDGTFQIYLMNADGTEQTNISNNSFDDSDPSWVPPAAADSTPPTGTVLINSGDATTTSPVVTLSLTCTDSESGCERIDVTFANPDANINSGAVDSISIDISSDSDPGGDRDAEETGPDTGIFQLTIVNSSDDIEFNDGDMITMDGPFFDTAPGIKSVEVEFTDGDDNSSIEGDSIVLEAPGPVDNIPPNHPPLSDLVSWYRAEDNLDDFIGNNDGVEQSVDGGVDFVTGKAGQAYQFDAADWVEIENDPSLNFGTGSFTISAWINRATATPMNVMVHGGSGCVTPIEAGWLLGIGVSSAIANSELGFDIRDEGGEELSRPIVAVTAPGAGEWHYVSAVVDRDNDIVRLYLDGQEADSADIPVGFGTPDNNGKPAIGANNRGGGGGETCDAAGFFDGSIDEVTIHSRALTAVEIENTFDAGNAVLINSGDESTNSPTVEVSLSCHDSGSGCDTIQLEFANIDADTTESADTISIDVHSTSDATPKTLEALETGSETGIFILEIDLGGETGGSIEFNDGDTVTAEGTFFDSAGGTKTVDALFIDGDGNSVSQSDSIILQSMHSTTLTLNALRDVTSTTGFTVSGELVDSVTGDPVTGQLITFTGSGVTPSLQSVTTEGVTFTGGMEMIACPTPSTPTAATCTTDNIGTDDTTSDNMVLHLDVGGKITFPEGTVTAKIYLQDMGTSSFKYVVEEGTGALQPEALSSGAESPVVSVLSIISGYTSGEPNGIKELIITEIDGSDTSGSIGIAALLTGNPDGLPIEQHQINFEEFAAGSQSSPFTVNAGSYFSTGFAQDIDEEGLEITAHFGGSSAHEASDSETQIYNVLANTAGLGGEGSQTLGGAIGTSITTLDCNTEVGSVDSDDDGICDVWETSGITLGGANYQLIGAVVGQPDIFVEIDCMTGFCPTATDLTAVRNVFEAEGYTLHIAVDENNLAVANPLHVWTDTDASITNDFANIKNNKFGTASERNAAGGTLGQGRDFLEAKAQVYHYGLFARTINTGTNTACGPSGQAELRGNDFIVSVGCTTTGGFKNSAQERQGTLMHELGHNLGLRHGGGDDNNCKPNMISVMNYGRQMPWGSLSATTASGAQTEWSLTYSREDLADLVETNLQEANGLQITTGQWTSGGTSSLAPGSSSFKIIWGLPAIKTAATGANVNWNFAAGNTASLNINSLSGMTGCGGTTKSTLQSYDEWKILDLNFRDEGSIDGVQFPDPDTLAELTPAVTEGAEAASMVGPNNVFNNPGVSVLPDVATDADGNIFVVWSEKQGGSSFEIYFSKSTDGGESFSPPENVSVNNADSLTPRIAVSDGNLYVVWSDKTAGTSGRFDIRFSKSSNMGDDWDPSIKLSSNSGDSITPSIAVFDSDIYIVWSDKTSGASGRFDILFKKSTDGGASFTPSGASGTKVSSNSGDSLTPDIKVSDSGIFVVWSDTSGGTSGKFDILFKKSTDGGATFLPNTANAKNISKNSGQSVTPSLAVDGSIVYVTWSDTTGGTSGNFDILFKKSTDGGNNFTPNTTNAKNISSTSRVSATPRIAISGATVYIAWSEFNTLINAEIFVSKSDDSGDNFDAAVNISNNNGPSITPAIAVLDPVVHLVWGDLTPGITGDILYASRIV